MHSLSQRIVLQHHVIAPAFRTVVETNGIFKDFLQKLEDLKSSNIGVDQFKAELGILMWHPAVRHLTIDNYLEMFRGFIGSILHCFRSEFAPFYSGQIDSIEKMEMLYNDFGIPPQYSPMFEHGLPDGYIKLLVEEVM